MTLNVYDRTSDGLETHVLKSRRVSKLCVTWLFPKSLTTHIRQTPHGLVIQPSGLKRAALS